MMRRTTAVSGWVAFPVSDPAWQNSHEGGMVVKLVVCDERDEGRFEMCCGATVYDLLSEELVGDDQRPRPARVESYETLEDVRSEEAAYRAWRAYHFPREFDETVEGAERYMSRDYLAAMVLGTTGWSGWSETTGAPWTCRFEDLTEEGKGLYRQMQQLYPGCSIRLLTYLDT